MRWSCEGESAYRRGSLNWEGTIPPFFLLPILEEGLTHN